MQKSIEVLSGNIQEFLQKNDLSELIDLYNEAAGNSEAQKLENLFKEAQEESECNLKIMSIHKSKGLGADVVFMLGLTEGIIPNTKNGNDSIEASRRLFYVGMTRAKQSLYLLSYIDFEGQNVHTVNKSDFRYVPSSKKYKGKLSRFIAELRLDEED